MCSHPSYDYVSRLPINLTSSKKCSSFILTDKLFSSWTTIATGAFLSMLNFWIILSLIYVCVCLCVYVCLYPSCIFHSDQTSAFLISGAPKMSQFGYLRVNPIQSIDFNLKITQIYPFKPSSKFCFLCFVTKHRSGRCKEVINSAHCYVHIKGLQKDLLKRLNICTCALVLSYLHFRSYII